MSAIDGSIAGIDVTLDPLDIGLADELDPAVGGDSRILVKRRDVAHLDAPAAQRTAFYGPVSAWVTGTSATFVGRRTRVDVDARGVWVSTLGGATPERLAVELGLHAALRAHHRHHLHAALVRAPGGQRMVICGASGAGKSTLCLALHRLDWEIGGDDIAYVGRDGTVWSLRRPLHVTSSTLSLIAGDAPGDRSSDGKHVLSAIPRRDVSGRPDLLVFPRITSGERSVASPMASLDALPSLVLASAFGVLDASDNVRRALSELARSARASALVLARDVLAAPTSTLRRVAGDLAGTS